MSRTLQTSANEEKSHYCSRSENRLQRHLCEGWRDQITVQQLRRQRRQSSFIARSRKTDHRMRGRCYELLRIARANLAARRYALPCVNTLDALRAPRWMRYVPPVILAYRKRMGARRTFCYVHAPSAVHVMAQSPSRQGNKSTTWAIFGCTVAQSTKCMSILNQSKRVI